MALIDVKNISYSYQNNSPSVSAAVKNVSFSICDGEFWGIIGHTGSGKSTLTELMCGLIKPNLGEITAFGVNYSETKNPIKALRGKIGLVFQYPEHQLFEETVIKDICFGPIKLGSSAEEAQRRAREAMELVRLSSKYAEASPFELSGGQKRRAAIAGVLAMHPDVLILDEPTAGLDPTGRDDLLEMLFDVKKMWCKSVVLVSHSMEDVAKVADRVLVMKDGEAVMQGNTRDVFKRERELEKIGLDAPSVSKLAARLREMGCMDLGDVLTLEEAATAIYEKIMR